MAAEVLNDQAEADILGNQPEQFLPRRTGSDREGQGDQKNSGQWPAARS